MNNKINIPESLAKQLAAFEKKLKVVETIVTILGGFCGLLLTYSLLFLSDRLWDTPSLIRAPLTIGGAFTAAYFSYRWLRHWWWKRRDTRSLARMIQKHYRKLGDRLLGAVELANGTELPDNISPALCEAAIRQVTSEAANYDFAGAVELKKTKNFALLFAVTAGIIICLFAIFPQAGFNSLMRWFRPFAPVERYTFVSIQNLPASMKVPHGEDFVIPCKIDKISRWRPTKASCSIQGQPRIQTKVRGGKAIFSIPGQIKQEYLNIKIGDFSKNILIIPVHRPELVELISRVTYPAYLEQPIKTNRIESADAEFLNGSRVVFDGRVSRAIISAYLTSVKDTTSNSVALAHSGAGFSSPELKTDELNSIALSWTDTNSMECMSPYNLSIITVEDETPLIKCSGIGRSVAMLEDEILELHIDTEDDFGIKEVWINWSCLESRKATPSDLYGTENIGKGSPGTRTISGKFTFSPIAAHIPDETMISLCAYASDYMPDRKPAMSVVYRIYILSKAEHAKLLLNQMEATQARIEDLINEEKENKLSNEELAGLDQEQMSSKKTAEQLKNNKLTEKSNEAKLQNIADAVKDILKEALRNKDIPEKTLAEWAQMADSMENVSENQMKQAGKSLSKAQNNSQTRKENIEKAIAKEKEAIDQLKQMEKDIDSSINSMVAQNFINRLKAIADAESEIADRYAKILPDMIGMSAEDIKGEHKKSLDIFATRQRESRKKTRYIHDDLAGFYNRTRLDCYNVVHTEMSETNVVQNLSELTKLIEQNIGMKAIKQAKDWSVQFNAWADYLDNEAEKNKKNEDGEGESVEISAEDMELLLALMRARQREETLRDQTRLIDEGRTKNRRYASDASKLSTAQNELARDIRPLERKAKNNKLRSFIEKIGGEMMNAGMYLRKPQTDSATIAIQTEIIELLSKSIDEAGSQSGSMSGAMQAMMLSMTGKGSMMGGNTDKGNTDIEGSGKGNDPSESGIEKASGTDTTRLPTEFRNVLEEYFKAMEKEK